MANASRLVSMSNLLRELSNESDPIRSVDFVARSTNDLFADQGYISVSTRGLSEGSYRIMRLHHPDAVREGGQEEISFAGADAPVHSGGLIGELIGTEVPIVLQDAHIVGDSVLEDQLSPYGQLVAFPIFDAGVVTNLAIHLYPKTQTLSDVEVEIWFLLTNFAGGVTNYKRVAQELRESIAMRDRLEAENAYLQDEITHELPFSNIIRRSTALEEVLLKVKQVSSTTATVLILGETGTGKELLARAVHSSSKRASRALVKVNCAALPATLIESELFGHEKGAFTGALERKMGRFELADGGTIFLDEIGELPLELQPKLLRVLQDGEFERLGNPRTLKVDVRVIAASNRDLGELVETGEFREDLYYRLNVFPIHAPPLRERIEDIAPLARHFLQKYTAKIGKPIDGIPKDVIASLEGYDWPGNVRELENIIERAVILSSDGTLELQERLVGKRAGSGPLEAKNETLPEIEVVMIRNALNESDWTIQGFKGAAAALGIAPSTLRGRIKKHGIAKP